MAGMTMAGQTTLGYIDAAGVNNQWQQGMFMPPGMMQVPQMPPPPPGMFPPMNPWMPYYGMPYMMSPYYSNCPPGFSMNNQWQPGSNQWQPGINQWQPGNNQWQPGNNQWQPGNNQWQPGNNQWQQGSNKCQPNNNNLQPGNNQCQPNNNNLQPGNNQCQPTNNNWQPGNNPNNQYYGYQQQPGSTQQGYQVPCNQGNKPDYQQQQQHNHGNQQGHQQQQENPQDNQQQGQPIPPPRRRNNRQTTDNLPKGLRYDGTENWLGFKTKFTRHMEVKNWTNEESKDYLSLSLEGKASEYYATLVTRNEDIGFPDVLSKLEKRFGGVPLPDTAQTQLANSRQQPEESIEDWADRVVQLSVHAFPDLPEDYMYQQAVRRICHGCTDEEAAEYAVNMDLNSVQLVVDKIKSYQFNHQLIFDQGEQEMQEGQEPTDSSDSDDTERRPRVKVKLIRSSRTQNGQGHQDDVQLMELTRQNGQHQGRHE